MLLIADMISRRSDGKKIYEEMGIKISVEEEKQRFVNRINLSIFNEFKNNSSYKDIFKSVCYRLGINADDKMESGVSNFIVPHFRKLTRDDFFKTLELVICLYSVYPKGTNESKRINSSIESAISLSTCDLGVRWNDGMFYPSGADTLDEKLIEEPLLWLKGYPKVRQDYLDALKNYIHGNNEEAVSRCYLVVEGLAQDILNNKKSFDNNISDLLATLKVNQEAKNIFASYSKYAHELARHASKNQKDDLAKHEVEFYLYLTGTVVRLIVQSLSA